MSMKYKLRSAVGVSAEVAGAELERINSEHGALVASVVVDEARPDEAPLHPAFEWNDGIAGERYRHWQARNLIRAVHIVEDDGTDKGCAYVNATVTADDGAESRGYYPVAEVVNSPDLYESALDLLRRKAAEIARAVSDLETSANAPSRKRRVRKVKRAAEQMQAALA